LVATPETPEIEMCPPLRPSKKSRSTQMGSPSRANPMGSRRPISSAYSALSRLAPDTRYTGSPGSGATQISGSTRMVCTEAERASSAGSDPSSAMRNMSDSNRAPS
jgi:hypothetical protein